MCKKDKWHVYVMIDNEVIAKRQIPANQVERFARSFGIWWEEDSAFNKTCFDFLEVGIFRGDYEFLVKA